MKVLLHKCVPWDLGKALGEHEVSTVQKEGWASTGNGQLLRLAEPRFDAFITVDTKMRFQQPTERFALALIVIQARSNRPKDVLPFAPQVLDVLASMQPRDIQVLGSL